MDVGKRQQQPRAPAPGRPARHDPEYVRGGVVNLFLVCEPLRGWRRVRTSDRRTRLDWAHYVRDLVDVHVPHAATVVLVTDQVNTHSPASRWRSRRPPRRSTGASLRPRRASSSA